MRCHSVQGSQGTRHPAFPVCSPRTLSWCCSSGLSHIWESLPGLAGRVSQDEKKNIFLCLLAVVSPSTTFRKCTIAVSLESTTPSSRTTTVTSPGPTTPPRGTNTTATTSNGTSTSPAPPRKEENAKGYLRPGEVVLVTLASVAMAVTLLTGLLFHFRNSLSLRNLFSVDLAPPPWPYPHGSYEVPEGSRATVTDFRGDLFLPAAMELTGRHEWS
nr:uncharacterized protein LOC116284500 [Vicugna pacos]